MALNFPDNPTNGQEYEAENGVVYTYNASIDAWTGSSAAGDNYWKETDDGSALTTVTADENLEIGGNLQARSIRTDATGGGITANYSFKTESTDPNHGVFVGTSDSSNATKDNSNAFISGAGSGYFGDWSYTETDKSGVHVGSYGYIGVQRSASQTNAAVFELYLGSAVTAQMLSNGSITSENVITAKTFNLGALDPLP